ncbi:type II toxin-antitoxin system PemK/MazF family toxin [Tianweitania sp. Rool2]|uniref:Type II toxin-antitoxin system PemK/MazF family toxin n=1 Tax=Oryzicola mucosus TaxID=2767425 RepID=A0A8J6PVV0_9HYPH|nr:type II toxin-antitoxin system PemK/MazF family toxin [Oryzicola mucosus]
MPNPIPGLVIRYSYLWLSEHEVGQEEGRKDRPCAIVLSAKTEAGRTVVIVVPVTHTPPAKDSVSIEIPSTTKQRLGLDDERSWIIVSEANRFFWPGPDIRPSRNGDMSTVAYGELPANLFRKLRATFVDA